MPCRGSGAHPEESAATGDSFHPSLGSSFVKSSRFAALHLKRAAAACPGAGEHDHTVARSNSRHGRLAHRRGWSVGRRRP